MLGTPNLASLNQLQDPKSVLQTHLARAIADG